ncbi:iron-containing alcohol dehydrogenase [Peribacillus simplex]|uniref:hydroxyacid-oxoacid transhydrogenase n=1 Tax=Peribacillus simplex TaxID=1478 RepID=UPI0010BEF4F6|nr:hydroxyacid-oxoacid transhydrogenase [Peribacillus simplex]TKH03450.1 iron-containing alcohol dehydrogenase [Peribacillus simplex]
MNKIWDFFSSERIVFGNGSINRLNLVLERLQARNVLLITDPGIMSTGMVEPIISMLKESGVSVVLYDKAVPEPPIETAIECYQFAQSQIKTDVIIGLGGGSSIDLAKIVSLLLAHGGSPLEYAGEYKVPGPVIPLVAIPTTAGTGSEVTSVAVLTDVKNNLKVGISDNYLRPTVALLDPELTIGLPPYVTACSGIDALSHAIEAYMAKDYKYLQGEGEVLFQGSFPLSDVLAFEAIRLITESLTIAVQQGANLEARSNMMLGSLLAGMAFSNSGTAAAHALAYPIGGLTKSPHGEVTGLLLPYVMKFNSMVQLEKTKKIANVLHINTNTMNNQEIGIAVSDFFLQLLESIGLPSKLTEIGIAEVDIPEIAEKALTIERLIRINPRVPRKKEFETLLTMAL